MQPKMRRSGRGYYPPEEWSPIGQAKIQGTLRRSKRGLQVEEKGQSMEGRSRMAMSTEGPDQGGAQCPREGTRSRMLDPDSTWQTERFLRGRGSGERAPEADDQHQAAWGPGGR